MSFLIFVWQERRRLGIVWVLLLIALVILLAAAACGYSGQPDTSPSGIADKVTDNVFRIQDNEQGVTCWIFVAMEKAGISCIPNTELLDAR